MKIVERLNKFKNRPRAIRPYRVVLHHTAGGTILGAESALKSRGLGYHYMISKKGIIYEYVKPHRLCYHAYKNNMGTVGVAFIGGGKYGPANQEQLRALGVLLEVMKDEYPSIREITGHKHIDPRGWKIDPHFAGEPVNGIDLDIDKKEMDRIARLSGLEFISKRGK